MILQRSPSSTRGSVRIVALVLLALPLSFCCVTSFASASAEAKARGSSHYESIRGDDSVGTQLPSLEGGGGKFDLYALEITNPDLTLLDEDAGINIDVAYYSEKGLSSQADVCVSSGLEVPHNPDACPACAELREKYDAGEIDDLLFIDVQPAELIQREAEEGEAVRMRKSYADSPTLVYAVNLPKPDDAESIEIYACAKGKIESGHVRDNDTYVSFNLKSFGDEEFEPCPFGVSYRRPSVHTPPDDDNDDEAEDEDEEKIYGDDDDDTRNDGDVEKARTSDPLEGLLFVGGLVVFCLFVTAVCFYYYEE